MLYSVRILFIHMFDSIREFRHILKGIRRLARTRPFTYMIWRYEPHKQNSVSKYKDYTHSMQEDAHVMYYKQTFHHILVVLTSSCKSKNRWSDKAIFVIVLSLRFTLFFHCESKIGVQTLSLRLFIFSPIYEYIIYYVHT